MLKSLWRTLIGDFLSRSLRLEVINSGSGRLLSVKPTGAVVAPIICLVEETAYSLNNQTSQSVDSKLRVAASAAS